MKFKWIEIELIDFSFRLINAAIKPNFRSNKQFSFQPQISQLIPFLISFSNSLRQNILAELKSGIKADWLEWNWLAFWPRHQSL